MSALNKLEAVGTWYETVFPNDVRSFRPQEETASFCEIEQLTEEKFPTALASLYRAYNEETSSERGRILGHSLVEFDQMLDWLRQARDTIKPQHPLIPNHTAANQHASKIVKLLDNAIPSGNGGWHRIDFECSPNSMDGPYLYPSERTTDQERDILELGDDVKNEMWRVTEAFHKLEKETFGWDYLVFQVFANGMYDIWRRYYDLDNELPLSSRPEGAIRKKYLYHKWLPVLHDGCNDFIGIHLDPDTNGMTGQIIVFG